MSAPFCVNYKHYGSICQLKLRVYTDLVTGGTIQDTPLRDDTCSKQRRAVSKIARLFGSKRCGAEGRNYESKY